MKPKYMVAAIVISLFSGISFAAEDQTLLIGINTPLSGSYSQQGEDQLRAYKLAIDKVNQEGGVLGKKLIYMVKDSQTNENVARQNAIDFIHRGAVMITGGSSSAEAIALSEECQKAGVIFMAGLTHSNDTTGKDAHRHCFRWYHNAHQSAKAIAKTLIQKFGPQAKYAYIYADYTWGITLQTSMQQVMEAAGCKTVLNLSTKLGEKSYVSALLKVKTAKPDVLVLVHFGDDMINSLKQAHLMKLRKDMEIVVPLMEIHMAKSVGPEIIQGIITTMCWYHGLSEKYPGSAEFVSRFEQAYHKKPGNAAATAWVNIHQYVDAVRRAGSANNIQVIKALEGHRFTLLGDEEYWRDWDHQGIHPTFIAIGKTPAESRDEWDMFTIIDSQGGEELARTREENPVQLEPY